VLHALPFTLADERDDVPYSLHVFVLPLAHAARHASSDDDERHVPAPGDAFAHDDKPDVFVPSNDDERHVHAPGDDEHRHALLISSDDGDDEWHEHATNDDEQRHVLLCSPNAANEWGVHAFVDDELPLSLLHPAVHILYKQRRHFLPVGIHAKHADEHGHEPLHALLHALHTIAMHAEHVPHHEHAAYDTLPVPLHALPHDANADDGDDDDAP